MTTSISKTWIDVCAEEFRPHFEGTFGKPIDADTIADLRAALAAIEHQQRLTLETAFHEACRHGSDISEHLPTLAGLAARCERITELGTRTGNSTRAFLYAKPKLLTAVDIRHHSKTLSLLSHIRDSATQLDFIEADDLAIEIPPCDLLFIDTRHTYRQLQAELRLHAGRTKKWLVFHDTVTFGERGEDGEPGLNPAIYEFLDAAPSWRVERVYANNNGLTVLRRES